MLKYCPPRRARTGATGLLAAPLLAVTLHVVGCSPNDPSCTTGIWPFDQATNVSTDAVITFTYPDSLPANLPALNSDVLSLRRVSDNSLVEVDYEFPSGPTSGVIRLIPRAPLEPNQEYIASGIMMSGFSSNNYVAPRDSDNEGARARFNTGGSFKVVTAVSSLEQGLVLVLSEAVTLESAQSATYTLTYTDGETTQVSTAAFSNFFLDMDHLVALTPSSYGQTIERIEFNSLTSVRGETLTNGSLLVSDSTLASPYAGDVSCTSVPSTSTVY